jgi:hypothetical protein
VFSIGCPYFKLNESRTLKKGALQGTAKEEELRRPGYGGARIAMVFISSPQ